MAEDKGGAWAEVVPWEIAWDGGAPMPHVVSGRLRTFLVYYAATSDAAGEPVVIADLSPCTAVKIGPPNDEVLHGHPLGGRGLQMYEAHVVHRSPWIAELRSMNSVHRHFDPIRWTQLVHWLLVFHDETVEFVASSRPRLELVEAPISSVLQDCVLRC